jgi:ubiquitin carboxyl-terminal hydrolase 8
VSSHVLHFSFAQVQCLNQIESFSQYFLQERYLKDMNRLNPLGSGGNVATAYASLLKKVWSNEYSTLVPRLLKRAVANFAPQFDNSYQQDSQEFCQFLLDGIHEDLNRVQHKPYVEELECFGMKDDIAAVESWKKHLLRHDSVIVDHFQGLHRSHITCPKCGRESIKFDVYSSISLPLATAKHRANIKLHDCIEKFMEGEQLDEKNAWYCPNCRKHVCALSGMLGSKIDHKVEFPLDKLDLSKIVLGPIDPNAPPIYTLIGVSEHIGPTANSGHYTATVRSGVDGQWYRCNDSHVGLTSGDAAVTDGAYLLFYQRSKGLSKWGSMGYLMETRGIDLHGGPRTDHEGFTKVANKKKRHSKGQK